MRPEESASKRLDPATIGHGIESRASHEADAQHLRNPGHAATRVIPRRLDGTSAVPGSPHSTCGALRYNRRYKHDPSSLVFLIILGREAQRWGSHRMGGSRLNRGLKIVMVICPRQNRPP